MEDAACLTPPRRSTWPASPRAGTIPERGDGWTRDLQATLVRLVVAHLPKGTVRAIAAVDGPLAYLSDHRRRPAGLQAGGSAQQP